MVCLLWGSTDITCPSCLRKMLLHWFQHILYDLFNQSWLPGSHLQVSERELRELRVLEHQCVCVCVCSGQLFLFSRFWHLPCWLGTVGMEPYNLQPSTISPKLWCGFGTGGSGGVKVQCIIDCNDSWKRQHNPTHKTWTPNDWKIVESLAAFFFVKPTFRVMNVVKCTHTYIAVILY